MRILRVHAKAFGPLRDQTLELERGMNVVCGPNEAGKSTWHAAIFAGLCGMRRARGKRDEDKRFEERHRPWSGEDWSIEIDFELASGRRIQILQDLAGKVESHAIDRLTGRDVTGEILNEGTPDGSIFLGLNRSILHETICIRQADVLRVLANSAELQVHLQRAAAAGGAGEPAEAAIRRVEAFQAEQVGLARVGARKPLRVALNELEASRGALEAARAAHAAYLLLVERREAAESQAGDAERLLRSVERAVAGRELEEFGEKVRRARHIAAHFPEGEPAEPFLDLNRLTRVQDALTTFEHRPPEPLPIEGPSAAELEAEIRNLPEVPAEEVEAAAEPRRRPSPNLLLSAGVIATVAGALLAALGPGVLRLSGLAGGALGLVLLLLGTRRSNRERRGASSAERQQLLVRLALQRQATREQLARELRARRDAEATASGAAEQRRRVASKVRQVAAGVSVAAGVDDPERVVELLRDFKVRLEHGIDEGRKRREEWVALREILAGRSLDELEAELRRRKCEAAPLPGDAVVIPTGTALGPLLRESRRRFEEARGRLQHLNGEAAAQERGLPDVAAAEETVARAEEELRRVEVLKQTLGRTLQFLEGARDRVQRDIAPALTAAVERRLGRVTHNRYQEAAVDPADLTVRVRPANGLWRAAGLLSHGTMEQIYLLLRLGLAEHLATRGEPAPLLLDEVTIQADAVRTVALLELLHEISRERQIIVFSQEQEVTSWAEAHLQLPSDKLIRLAALAETFPKPAWTQG